MKKHIRLIIGVFGIALISAGCAPLTYAQDDTTGNYPTDTTDNGYNYDNGYDQTQAPPQPDESTYDYGTEGATDDQAYDSQEAPPSSAEPTITYNDFYSQLSPYGQWVNDPTYGRVWVPNEGNFQPYSTNGYWSYTNYGWTWISNYTWGWAPFHYGRWGFGGNRWFWVPGYSWGPAWVAWSTGSGMYGWAPLSPGLHLHAGISIGAISANLWTFMPNRYMGERNISSYYSPRSRNVTIIRNTTIINNYGTVNGKRRYTMGPSASDVEKVTGRTVERNRVVNSRDAKTAFEARNNPRTVVNNTQINNTRITNNNNNAQRVINNDRQTTNNNQARTNVNIQRPVTPPTNTNVQRPAVTNTPRNVSAPHTQVRSNVQMYRPQVHANTRPAAPMRSAPPARSGNSGGRRR